MRDGLMLGSMVSILVSTDPGIGRYLRPGIPAYRAVCQGITVVVSDSRRPDGGLISVSSVVRLHSGP